MVSFPCSSTILVGTKSSDIYEIVRLTGRMTQLSTSHCTDELWGLAPHPVNNDVFITCGDDRTVRLWSVAKKRQLAMVVQDNMMRVCFQGKLTACRLCLGGCCCVQARLGCRLMASLVAATYWKIFMCTYTMSGLSSITIDTTITCN